LVFGLRITGLAIVVLSFVSPNQSDCWFGMVGVDQSWIVGLNRRP
jgi:hypothetical protein